MKTSPTAARRDGDLKTSATAVIKVTEGRAPLPSETLLRLGVIFSEQEVAIALGDESETFTARGVIAGMIVTLHEILPAKQFRDVMIQWDIDAIKLSEILDIAGGASRTGEQTNTNNSDAIEA